MTSPDEHDNEEARRGRLVRRVLSQGPSPEQQLEELIAQRRDELDAHAERLRESITELERREELLRDSRASVERMLRLGTADLEAREAELTSFLASLTERETSLSDAEADLARRRQEVGAVELKRAAVERRERAVAARENELAELEQRAAELALDRSTGRGARRDRLRPRRALPTRRDRCDSSHARTRPRRRGVGVRRRTDRAIPAPGRRAALCLPRTGPRRPVGARRQLVDRRSLLSLVGGLHRSRAGARPAPRGTARPRCRPLRSGGAASRRARRGPTSVPTRGSGA